MSGWRSRNDGKPLNNRNPSRGGSRYGPSRDHAPSPGYRKEKSRHIIIKNLPLTLEPSELIEFLAEHNLEPEKVMYQNDDDDKFVGNAILECANPDEALHFFSVLKGSEIKHQKVYINFYDINNGTGSNYQEFFTQLLQFSESDETQLVFPATLTAGQRKQIHKIGTKLGLVHESVGEDDDRHIVITKPPPTNITGDKELASDTNRGNKFRDRMMQNRKNTEPVKPEAAAVAAPVVVVPPEPLVRPIRHPAVPDGTNGFTEEFMAVRLLEIAKMAKEKKSVIITDAHGNRIELKKPKQ